MISYVLPTRDRPEQLALTLSAIERLGDHAGARGLGGEGGSGAGVGAEVIVVDNASRFPPAVPFTLRSGVPVKLVLRAANEGAAGRNAGVRAADPRSEWIVMLDDDSHPLDTGFLRSLGRAGADVGAVSADIRLPSGRRESGGLPEVFIGCGVAIRRRAWLDVAGYTGGYDPSFNYYVEEYDLAARLLLAGYRVRFDPWFRVLHRKDASNRDMNVILSRLVRNNGWVAQRYAPDERRRGELREVRRRYRGIALREKALVGYAAGVIDLRRTLARQARTPMSPALFDRFVGLAPAREALAAAQRERPFTTAAVVDEGKNAWVVRGALDELGVRVVDQRDGPEAVVIGTMSPGPMLDAYERRVAMKREGETRVIAPWLGVAERWPAWKRDVLTGGVPAGMPARAGVLPRVAAAEGPARISA